LVYFPPSVTHQTTKERIIEAAEGLMLEKSFHSVGLNEILAAVEVPKGSFYHHFSSKEQFGVEMLRHYVAGSTEFRRQFLLSTSTEPDPILRLLAFVEGITAKIIAHEGKCPCLIIKLSSEISDFSEPMREVLVRGNSEWIEIYERLLEEAIAKNKIPKTIQPNLTATLLHDLLTGATQRAAIARNATPLREAVRSIRGLLSLS
jgi:TetR/AcrR family transcriptional regulator, transcriptional repressor for nem operon